MRSGSATQSGKPSTIRFDRGSPCRVVRYSPARPSSLRNDSSAVENRLLENEAIPLELSLLPVIEKRVCVKYDGRSNRRKSKQKSGKADAGSASVARASPAPGWRAT